LPGRVAASIGARARSSISLPVSAMVTGISSLPVLESCVNVVKTLKPLSPMEMMALNGRLASLDIKGCFPYHRRGYRDTRCYVQPARLTRVARPITSPHRRRRGEVGASARRVSPPHEPPPTLTLT
jgi:hypothetical protein